MKKNISKMSGIEIQILRDIKEKIHFHPEIEVIFVISGVLGVNVKDNYYELNNSDLIVLNSNNLHNIESINDSVICRIYISYKVLIEFINNGNYVFNCNSVEDKLNSYKEAKDIMKRIIFTYLGEQRKTECLRYGLVYELLDNLIENFQKDKDYFKYKNGKKESDQLQYIINYVNLNFQNSIKLSELAKDMYTSTSTLSRFIKKQLGIYFADFVNQVRLNYAVKDLLETDKTITKISADCGFSNASVFNKIFQSVYNMSPTVYRKQKLIEINSNESLLEENFEEIKNDIILLQEQEEGQRFSRKEIKEQVLVNQGEKYKRFWNNVLNIGAAYNIILADVQAHITYLVGELKFEYVRIWNIFSEKLMIQRNSCDYNYNFNMVDSVLDFLINLGVKPFIDFGKKPNCAVKAEDETVYYEEEYIDFKNMKEWHNMFQSFIYHIIKRYGKEEAEGWKFEFSVDVRPNRFYMKESEGSIEELFKESFKFIKKNLPKAEVGGFGVVMEVNYDKLLEWLKYCRENKCIPDFVSMISFPYIQVLEDKKVFAKRITDQPSVANQVHMARKILDNNGFAECKLYVTEWNNSLSNRNYLNDSCFRAAYVSKMAIELWNIPDIMSIWMGSDLVSSYYDTSQITNGASGLITKDKIRKPVYYSLLFLNKLGERFIQKGENYIVTSNGLHNYYILCFNFKEYNYEYYLKHENNVEVSELKKLFENDDELNLQIDLVGMPDNQKFVIKKHIVNNDHGSILNEWSKFKYEKYIEENDLKHLRNVCIPDITMEKQIVENNILRISTILQSHEILFINVYEDN